MAFTITTKTPTSHSDVYFQFKEAMKVGGWVVTQSGNATIYDPSGDSIPNATVMNAGTCWFVLSHPSLDGYQRHICFQQGNARSEARIKFAWGSGFNGGSPSATIVPTGADERLIWGTGTDASPTFAGFIANTLTDNVPNFIVGDVDEQYSFIWFTNKSVSGVAGSILMMDRMTDTNPADIDPYLYYAWGGPTYPTSSEDHVIFNGSSTGSSNFRVWVKKGTSEARWQRAIVNYYSLANSSTWLVNRVGTNPYSGEDYHLPAMIFCPTTAITSGNSCYKGKLKNVTLCGTQKMSMDTSLNKTRIHCGPLVFPWNGTNPIY